MTDDLKPPPDPNIVGVFLRLDPETHDIEITVSTQTEFDKTNAAHAIARYIAMHFGEIIQATKEARTRGEMDGEARIGGGAPIPDDANLQLPDRAIKRKPVVLLDSRGLPIDPILGPQDAG